MTTDTQPKVPTPAEYREKYMATTEATLNAVRERLAALPDTADEIATFLAGEGIKGICANANKCAIAEYLVPALPAGWIVSVDGSVTVTPVAPVAPVFFGSDDVLDWMLDKMDWRNMSGDEIDVLEEEIYAIRKESTIQTSNVVHEFIRAFDAHQYPDLEVGRENAL